MLRLTWFQCKLYSCAAKRASKPTLWRTNRIHSPRNLCHRQEHRSYGLRLSMTSMQLSCEPSIHSHIQLVVHNNLCTVISLTADTTMSNEIGEWEKGSKMRKYWAWQYSMKCGWSHSERFWSTRVSCGITTKLLCHTVTVFPLFRC